MADRTMAVRGLSLNRMVRGLRWATRLLPVIAWSGFAVHWYRILVMRERTLDPAEPVGFALGGTALAALNMGVRRTPGSVAGLVLSAAAIPFMRWYVDSYSRYGRTGSHPAVGERFPDFELPTSEGGRFSLRFPRERGAVVVCYRGAWCPFCLTELRELQEHYGALVSRGVDVIAVSVDEPEVTRVLRARLGLDITFLCDNGGALMDALDIRDVDGLFVGLDRTPLASGRESRDVYVPATFVVDAGGVVRWVHRPESYRVRPPATEVVEAVDVMLAPEPVRA